MEFNLNGPGSVGDRVWLDENRNGVLMLREPAQRTLALRAAA